MGYSSIQRSTFYGFNSGEENQWQTIEDDDRARTYKGFRNPTEQWNASGATLSVGQSNCSAEITFKGKAMQLFSYRSIDSGAIKST